MTIKSKLEDLLEQIQKFLPDYSGYHEKAYTLDSDRLLRHHLANELERRKNELQATWEKLFMEGKLSADNEIEILVVKMGKMSDKLRESSYERDAVEEELNETLLESLYEQDLSLLDHIEGLITPMDRMEKTMEESESFNGELAILIEAVAHIEEQIKRRESLIRGN